MSTVKDTATAIPRWPRPLVETDAGQREFNPKEKNDCVVRATALAFKIPYAEAHEIFAGYGRVCGTGVFKCSEREAWEKLCKKLGKKLIKHSFPAQKGKPRMNVIDFCCSHPIGTFLTIQAHHTATVINGFLHDCGVNMYSWERCVYNAFEVVDDTQEEEEGEDTEGGVRLRVWHTYAHAGCEREMHTHDVATVGEAKDLIQKLSNSQVNDNSITYNAFGLEQFENREWSEWMDEQGNDILELMEPIEEEEESEDGGCGWTPTPWKISVDCNKTEIVSVSCAIASVDPSLKTLHEKLENARRIVSCVNGCTGLNPEAVQGLVEALEKLLEEARNCVAEHEEDAISDNVIENAESALAKAKSI